MVTNEKARCTVRSYLIVVALIFGLLGAYFALLPFAA